MNHGLDANAVYIAPSGRRCRWVPLGGKYGSWTWFYFAYIRPSQSARRSVVMAEGFTLSPANVGMLRKEAADASAR